MNDILDYGKSFSVVDKLDCRQQYFFVVGGSTLTIYIKKSLNTITNIAYIIFIQNFCGCYHHSSSILKKKGAFKLEVICILMYLVNVAIHFWNIVKVVIIFVAIKGDGSHS